MTRMIPIGAMAVLALAATHASAQMIYDSFNYGSNSIGTPFGNLTGAPANAGYINPMNGQQWFETDAPASGPAVGPEPSILAGSLPTQTGQPTGVGNSIQSLNNATSTPSPRIGFVPGLSSGMIYYSLSFRVADITGLTTATTGAFFAGFNNLTGTQTTTPSTVLGRINLYRTSATSSSYVVGIRSNGATTSYPPGLTFQADHLDTDNNPVQGDTIFVVVGVDPTVGSPKTQMWIDPDPSLFGQAVAPATSLSLTDGADPVGGITSFTFRFGSTALAKNIVVDDIRVDKTWAQVAPAAGSTWTGASSTTWGDPTNWSTASIPNATGQFVNFNGAGANINLTSAKTIGTLNLTGPGAYNLSGAAITLDGSTINPATSALDAGPATLNVYAPVDATTGTPIATTHTISSPVNVNQNLNAHIAASQTLAFTNTLTFAPATTFTKTGPGTLQSTNFRVDTLVMNGGKLVVAPDGSSAATSVVKTLNMNFNATNSATIDLTNNDLIIDYTSTSPISATGPATLSTVRSGYNAGAWNGNGISSSAAASNTHTGLAVAEASDLLGPSGGSFSGQTVDGTAVLVKYTWYGDANLDGIINADDYAIIDRFVAKNGLGATTNARWLDGDFNYDGKVDASDYLLMDSAFAVNGGALTPSFLAQRQEEFGDAYVSQLIASVPEPTTLGLLAVATTLSAARRRRLA